MMNEQTQANEPEKIDEQTIVPDVSAGLFLQAQLTISDPESGEVLLKIKG